MADGREQSAEDFYDTIAGGYDGMFSFEARLGRAGRFLDELGERGEFATILDTGCGTGAYALAGAQRGLATTGVDVSKAMLAQARINATRLGVDVNWLRADMRALPQHLPGLARFDLILSMGNTLPHLLDTAALAETLAGFGQLLSNPGQLVLHLLNYEKILARQERIIGISQAGPREYVRFYDFIDPLVRFNLLEIDHSQTPPGHLLHETTLRPHTAGQIQKILAELDFTKTDIFGGLDFGPYVPAKSDTLLLVAQK